MKITTALAVGLIAGWALPAAAQTTIVAPPPPAPVPMTQTCTTTTTQQNPGKLVVIGRNGAVSTQEAPSEATHTSTVCSRG